MKKFQEWLNESKMEKSLGRAREIAHTPSMMELLNDVEEGKYPAIQLVKTPGATSYIAVAMNDGFPVSEVFPTDSPIEALLAMIIMNTDHDDLDFISGELKDKQFLLQYSVFAGSRKPSRDEIEKRFNVRYQDFADGSVSYYVSTPLVKRY